MGVDGGWFILWSEVDHFLMSSFLSINMISILAINKVLLLILKIILLFYNYFNFYFYCYFYCFFQFFLMYQQLLARHASEKIVSGTLALMTLKTK